MNERDIRLFKVDFKPKDNRFDVFNNDALKIANKYGKASMCMLGNSVFAIGEIENISKELNTYGKIYSCATDNLGARIIND